MSRGPSPRTSSLYGKGLHGNLYAVLDFMETSLGRRWVSRFEKPVVPLKRDLVIRPLDRKKGFSFAYRYLEYPGEYAYQNGINMEFSELNAAYKTRTHTDLFPPGVSSKTTIPGLVHSIFSYIPPSPERQRWRESFTWVQNKSYFNTNPEFFTMDASGKRVARHLCFSNPKLRAELTKNVLEHIRLAADGDQIVAVTQEDDGGRLCDCPECLKLEKKYQAAAGPMFDYLFDLCVILKDEHPDVMALTMPYKTTKKPIVLPEGKSFPDNLIVMLPDNGDRRVDRAWNSPGNTTNYELLSAWGKLTPHLWAYYYPNLYCAGSFMPFSSVYRFVTDLRLMNKAGVEGVFCDPSLVVASGDGFTELQQYVYCKLLKDIQSDVPALIREFTDHQFGGAAPLARKYFDELEDARETSKNPMRGYTYTTVEFDQEFAYLTSERIHRWQGYFDQMEKAVAADARCLKNVRRLRRLLEFATLGRWNDLAKAYPDYFKDYRDHKPKEIPRWCTSVVADFETVIQAGGKVKPLPEPLKNVDPSRVRRFVPTNTANSAQAKVQLDSEAAFGYAATIDLPDNPFHFGCFQWETRNPPSGKRVARITVERKEITPGTYQVRKLGAITVTPDCMIWFSGMSWQTNLEIGSRLYDPDGKNLWDAYVSLKFSGPAYGGQGKEDQVLCDQIILVRQKD